MTLPMGSPPQPAENGGRSHTKTWDLLIRLQLAQNGSRSKRKT